MRDRAEESNESAYAELVEFVRVGVQLLFEELGAGTPRAAGSQTRRRRAAAWLARRATRAGKHLRERSSRAAAASSCKLMGRDSIAILPAAPVRHRNNDVEYAYRQDSDFHYLTGFDEPEAVAVLVPGRDAAEYILFVRERDPQRETWDGRRAGPAGRGARLRRATTPFPITDIDEILPGLLENRTRVFYTMGAYRGVRPAGRRLGQWAAHSGAQRPPPAAGVRRARSRAARHAAVQVARRDRADARRGADRRRRAPARDALLPPGRAPNTR